MSELEDHFMLKMSKPFGWGYRIVFVMFAICLFFAWTRGVGFWNYFTIWIAVIMFLTLNNLQTKLMLKERQIYQVLDKVRP